jgi:hypothetical protein
MMSRHPVTAVAAMVVISFVASTSAPAVEYQVHGYAAQGFVYSDDNNFFGESSSGSTEYYEAGINGSVQVRPNLTFAAQAAIRDAGISDDGSLRLDYALADYRFLARREGNAGIRLGKVKNTMGFYNDTRDVIFTRPSILLPGVYSDNQNQRSLVFTGPGAQLYGSRVYGRHEWSFTGTTSKNRNVLRSDERLLINLPGVPFDLRIQDSWNAQIMDSLDGGRWQFAVSHFFGRFRLATPAAIGLAGKFDVSLTIFSARHNAERFSVVSEYVRNPNRNLLTLGGTPLLRTRSVADRGYIQGEYRIDARWGAFLRLDASYIDMHDRSGRQFAAANPGANRKSRMSRSVVAGLSWRDGKHWGVWGEYHWIDGTASLQALENPGFAPASRWSLLMLMAAYRF